MPWLEPGKPECIVKTAETPDVDLLAPTVFISFQELYTQLPFTVKKASEILQECLVADISRISSF
jgi:hypothetical protein